MTGKANVDWRAAELLAELMADRGWTAADIVRESAKTGHPMRRVSLRSVYRVVNAGHRPTNPVQFEIAAAFGLRPRHIWGRTPLPATALSELAA
jgi:lambda repressor-like predicted transcriptional regulator